MEAYCSNYKASYANIHVYNIDDHVSVSIFIDGEEIFNKKTGVYIKELALAFEDEVIPLRNLLEALGYETTEEFVSV